MKIVLMTCGLVIVCFSLLAGPSDIWVMQDGRLRNVVCPIYSEKSSQATAVLYLGRSYVEYEKRGFFRIGILPVAVFQDVSLEVLNRAKLEDAVAKALPSIENAERRRKVPVEIRGFRLECKQPDGLVIEAKTMIPVAKGRWKLWDVVLSLPGKVPVKLPESLLETQNGNVSGLFLKSPNLTVALTPTPTIKESHE